MTSPDQNDDESFRPFTNAERILQLNEIDRCLAQLVRSAGKALQELSSAQDDSSVIKTPPSAETRKELFQYSADSYLKNLQHIDVHLQRNILGLEEAGIIVRGTSKNNDQDASDLRTHKNPDQRKTTELGLSNLDIGWLNSRSASVDKEMETELFSQAKKFLEEMKDEEGKKNGGAAAADGVIEF